MPYVMSGGDDPKPYWVDDVTYQLQFAGQGAVPGPGNQNTNTGTGGTGQPNVQPTMQPTGFKWGGNMPGKGQFQDIPNTGPSDWRGVPFMQTDTSKGPLSSYYNVVDQYAASRNDRNPLQSEGNFNRWNFGGPNTPPDPRWQATSRGLLTGAPWRSPGPVNAAPLPTPGNGTGVGTGPGGLLGGTTPVPNPTPPPPQGGGAGGGYQPPIPGNPPGAPGFGPFPGQPPQMPIPQGQGSVGINTAQTGLLGRGQGQPAPTVGAYGNPQSLSDFYALNHNQRKAYQQANPNGLQAIINAHNAVLANQGLGPGAPVNSPFAPGQVGAK